MTDPLKSTGVSSFYSAFFSVYKKTIFIILVAVNTSVFFPAFPANKIDSLIAFVKQAKDIAKADALCKLSSEYYNSKPDSGIYYGSLALKLSGQLNYKKGIADANKSLAQCYWFKGNNQTALEFNLNALKIFEDLNNKKGISDVLQNIAIIYDYLGNYDKAAEYYMKALTLGEKEGTVTSLIYYNIADLYKTLKKNDNALRFFKKALDKGDDVQVKCWSLLDIGDIYAEKGLSDKAFEYYNEAFRLLRLIDDKRTISWVYFTMGNFYNNCGSYSEASRYYFVALTNAKEIGETRLAMDVYGLISKNYYEQGENAEAYRYLLLHSQLQDSLFKEQIQKDMLEMQTKYETSRREHEITLLKKNNELHEANLKQANALRNFLIVIVVLILVAGVIIYRIKSRSIQRLKEKQEIINKQKDDLEVINKQLILYQLKLEQLNRELEKKVEEEIKKREAQQLKLIQKSKLESLGIFSAGIAHEINQPLTSISFTLENMMYKKSNKKLTDDYLHNKFTLINDDIKRITNIINHIRTFAREQRNISFDKFNLNEVALNSKQIFSAQLRSRNIGIEFDLYERPLYVLGNKYRIEQVLLNLIINSRYAVERREQTANDDSYHKKITIKTYSENGSCVLMVEDNGTGIPEEVKNNIFEPFFTTKEPQEGTGLGLSIVYGIVKEHSGEITVESSENNFSRFQVKLPALKQE